MKKEAITKEERQALLEKFGVRCEILPAAIKKHIADAEIELGGNTFQASLNERIGLGVEIAVEGKQRACLITYEAILNMAIEMGLFDDEGENNE